MPTRLQRTSRPFRDYETQRVQSAYGRAQSVAPRLTRSDSPVRRVRPKGTGPGRSGVLYETALAQSAFGTPKLGDLFNDIMGAVVGPAWDERPQWMKDIRIKADPEKIVEQAARIVPPEKVGRVIDQARKVGVNLFYNTPAGEIPVTGQMAQTGYANYPVIARAQGAMGALANVPPMVWVGGGALLLILLMRR